MSKRRLTHGERLHKLLKEEEANPILSAELTTVQSIIVKPKKQAMRELLRLLKLNLHQTTKWFIASVLETSKDERIIRPLIQAARAPENASFDSFFLWPLTKHDCTKHLDSLVNLIIKLTEPGETMMVAVMVIRNMKGPFEPRVVRKSIRKLLTEVKVPTDADMKLRTEALRLEAADDIMVKYLNYMRKAYWNEIKGSITISETS